MPEGGGGRRLFGGFSSGLLVVGAWGLALLMAGTTRGLEDRLDDAIYRIFSGFPGTQQIGHRLFHVLAQSLTGAYVVSLTVATLVLPVAFLARMIARARLRAGHADPLDRARSWLSAGHARSALLVAALPVACQTSFALGVAHHGWSPLYLAIPALAAGLIQVALVRAGVRAFLAPTIESGNEPAVAIGRDELRFNAVAVTGETRAAVGALAAVSLGMIAWLASLPLAALFRDPRVFTAIGAYVAVAAASAVLFRGASRISVGVDGIYVGGTSRARFFAYRDLEGVRVQGGDVELVRRGRAVLRLQLHGDDAARRGAIVKRIEDALARVRDVERDAAANFVTSRSSANVAQSARGGGDYRMPSVSHDALWSLVEGAAVDAPTRTAAAKALVRTGAAGDRDRVRLAAAHCADPHLRVALRDLAACEIADEAAESPARSRASP